MKPFSPNGCEKSKAYCTICQEYERWMNANKSEDEDDNEDENEDENVNEDDDDEVEIIAAKSPDCTQSKSDDEDEDEDILDELLDSEFETVRVKRRRLKKRGPF